MDDGPDALLLPELERQLKTGCREYFKDDVQVESVSTAGSHESPLLQLADLFSGSVARRFNKEGETTNHKGEFAAFFETVAGFDFVKGGKSESDFVYVHQLGVINKVPVPQPGVLTEVVAPEPGSMVELTGQ